MITAPEEFVRNHAYVRYIRHLSELHELMKAGRGDSVDADDLRDEMDESWKRLTASQIERTDEVSADLYSLESGSPIQHPAKVDNQDAPAREQLQEAMRGRDWKNVLRILRTQPEQFDRAEAAYYRGRCWERLNEPEIAIRFYEEAARIRPEYLIPLVDCLRLRGMPDVAGKLLDDLVCMSRDWEPSLQAFLALSAMSLAMESVPLATRQLALRRAAGMLVLAASRAEKSDNRIRMGEWLGIAAFCSWLADQDQLALDYCTQAISRDPSKAETRVLRGWIQFKTNRELALADFRVAVEQGCAIFLPYRFLLARALQQKDLQEARRIVETAQLVHRTPEEDADFRQLCSRLETIAASGTDIATSAEDLPPYGKETLLRLAHDLAA